MAISIDALLAIIVFIAMIVFISIEPVSQSPVTQQKTTINQLVDDAVAAMDNTGFLMKKIYSSQPEDIGTRLDALLPETVGYMLELKRYASDLDDPLSTCRVDQDFSSCFPSTYEGEPNPKTIYTGGESVPEEKEIFHSRKILIKKEPGDCELFSLAGKRKLPVARLQANGIPEARDVNISTAASCPGERSPCPAAGETMRCCYEYYDPDSDPETNQEYRWWKYDFGEGNWLLAGETGQTVQLSDTDDGNRWKCNVRVFDGQDWSPDANSPFAIVGGPCFQFESSISSEPLECGVTTSVDFSITAEAGGRRTPVDIVLSLDRSGSMAWLDEANPSGTERSIFPYSDGNTVFVGTDSHVYKYDTNTLNGDLAVNDYQSIDDAYGLYADGNHVLVADDDTGLTVLDQATMNSLGGITDMTNARAVTGQGNYAFVAAQGTPESISLVDETAKVIGSQQQFSEDYNALDFVNGYMSMGNEDWGSQTGTISFWVKRDDTSNNDRFWGQHNDMEIRYYYGDLMLDWGTSSGTSGCVRIDDPVPDTGKWYFMAVTWDEIDNDLFVYVGDEDNAPQLVGSNYNWTYSVSDEGIDYGNLFMRSGSGYGSEVDGQADELRYYDTARSLAEIQSDYKQALSGTEANLVSYYMLDGTTEDSGPASKDASRQGLTEWITDTPLAPPPIEENSFETSSGYMVVGNGNEDWGSQTGTISFWVKMFSKSGNERFWGQDDRMEMRFSYGNFVLDWGTNGALYVSDPFTETNKWYFVAIAWDEISNDLYLYVGDEDTAPVEIGRESNWNYTVSDEGIRYGNWFTRSGSGYGSAMNGRGDDLRYYDNGRSLSEIQGDYLIELGGSETGLVSYFKLNGDFLDSGPAGDDGSSSGTTSWSDDTPMASLEGEAKIGYDSIESWAAQSFKPSIAGITKIKIPAMKTGSPGDLTLHVRESINGADKSNGTAVVSAASVLNSMGWIDFQLPGNGIGVTPGNTYYLALTAAGDSSNYYTWGAAKNEEDQYSDGTLWECNSSNACTERQPPNQADYEDAGFQLSFEGTGPGGLIIVDKSSPNPANWFVESSLYDTGSGTIQGNDIAVSGNYALITDDSDDGADGLWIVDISNPSSPAFDTLVSISDAVDVAAGNNYAYVVEQNNAVHVVDLAAKAVVNTLNSLGEVEGVDTDGSKLYVASNDTGSGATENAELVLDLNIASSPSLEKTFYFPYGAHSKIAVGSSLAYVFNSSYRLFTINKLLGPKMDIAKGSAQQFVLFEDWNAPDDKIGVTSYGNDDSDLDQPLLGATGPNKETINNSIEGIMAYGSTPMAYGLEESLDELLSSSRQRDDAVKFVILLADGQCNSPYNCDSLLDTQVEIAKANRVYIFTIGFGGDVDEQQLIDMAEYCEDGNTECEEGKYYQASDPNALNAVYEIISKDIAALAGLVPDGQSTNLTMPFGDFNGMVLSNIEPSESANWDPDDQVLEFTHINIRQEWAGSFDVYIPCDYVDCAIEFTPNAETEFPPSDTVIEFAIEEEVLDPVNWPEKFTAGGLLYYNDLTIDFIEGQFRGVNDTTLTYDVRNSGYINGIDLSAMDPGVAFYVDADDPLEACDERYNQFVSGDNFDDPAVVLDAENNPEASLPIAERTTTRLPESGWLCMWVNKNKEIDECSENNTAVVHCAIPETFVYTLDYWAWDK